MNILIAEGDGATAHLLSKRLLGLGHETIVALNTMQAIMACRRRLLPDLVILDFQLAGGGGIPVLDRIRSARKTLTLPVVILTATLDSEAEALEAGADAYLVKPPDFDLLVPILEHLHAMSRPKKPSLTESVSCPALPHTTARRIVRNIMLVEDNRVIADLMAARLKRAGFATIFAHGVPEALRVVSSFRIDGVVINIELPGGSGLGVIQRMKSLSLTRDTPVLMASGTRDAYFPHFALAAGVDRFFHQPVDPDAIITALRELLSRAHQEQPIATT